MIQAVKNLCGALLARDPIRRARSRYRLLEAIADRAGFRLHNQNLAWLEDEDYLAAWNEFGESDGRVKDRKFVLYSMVRSLASVPGDTAECGVFNGGSSHLICRARLDRPDSLHHAFDSFEGLSEPDAPDLPSDPTAFRWRKNDLSVPLEVVRANLARFPNVRYHRGWIPERFHEVEDRRFAFVHVDVDLFQPTLDSIAFFYPRLEAGGVLLCDDYGFTTCPGSRRAFDEFLADKPEGRVVHLATGQGFVVKR